MQGAGSAPTAQKQVVQRPFAEALARGKEWEWVVYGLLKVRYPDIRRPLTYEEAIGRVDEEPDMAVRGLAVQCKRREFNFTCATDFPYQTVMIDEEYKLRSDYISQDEYLSMPEHERLQNLKQFMCYFIASQDMTHMAVVIPASKAYWRLRKRDLKRDARPSYSWECPKSKALFMPVEKWRMILTWV
jgi:hypothetical protein